jgi:FtsP/CotA-like multicopper oxidase with cupredoxin domain
VTTTRSRVLLGAATLTTGVLGEVEFDFVADHPGDTLFRCHQQLHMDFGFMALFKYA